ncbi:uncharacterized protein BXZ73DRAFT_75023 [Epithele typhae]|uniref:uncharacterized protein n=1 Tax=Epithele typhae TaxID=378194 RepID=UPI0020089D29|nr:uncharacterized protein BXZ73DRAFT_75023 [Epithele typhae]KAH9941845.1 hypothetical protein BXZ73DRAFT_75023 [Epithele typhae]
MSGKGSGKSKSGKASGDAPTKGQSRSAKAGLQFPVGRVHRLLKKGNYAQRVGAGAPVYLAAVLEYLAAEILELAGNAARDNKKQRIVPRHLQLAIRNDEELNKLLGNVVISQGGVVPFINPELLPSKTQKGKKEGAADAERKGGDGKAFLSGAFTAQGGGTGSDLRWPRGRAQGMTSEHVWRVAVGGWGTNDTPPDSAPVAALLFALPPRSPPPTFHPSRRPPSLPVALFRPPPSPSSPPSSPGAHTSGLWIHYSLHGLIDPAMTARPSMSNPAGASSTSSPTAGTGPTNDDIEAVIQMAMASSSAPRVTNPPRDTRTQLYVGNLPYRVRWQDLKDLFRRAGTVLRADVSLGPDNRSRGYGTVLLATAEDAGRAVDMFNGYAWQTRTLEVRPDRMGEELGPGVPGFPMPGAVGSGIANASLGVGIFGSPILGNMSPAAGSLSGNGSPAVTSALSSPAPGHPRFPAWGVGEDEFSIRTESTVQASRNLFVGNLPFHIQWQDLKDLFRQAGAVQRADVALGADGRSRGFGTVSFSNETDAERAVKMFNGYEYNGRPLKVHFDKFAPPASSSAPLVGPTAVSAPHSPASFVFPGSNSSAFSTPGGVYAQPSLARASSLAQQLLQSQLEQSRGQISSRRSNLGYGAPGYEEGSRSAGAESEATLVLQLAQQLSLGSSAHSHEQEVQRPSQTYASHAHPTHISIPAAIQSPYTFDFLHSGPRTPYDIYDLNSYHQRLSAGGYVAAPQPQEQSQYSTANQARPASQRDSPSMNSAAHQDTSPDSAVLSTSSPSQSAASSSASPPGASTQATSPASSTSRSHPTPQQTQHHPAHPGPIALPPPPPVTAFPVPPPHTLSPQYIGSPIGHPMSPMHHPLMGMSMPMMTPHGLPPITPSMPSFTFLPQLSPGLPSPAGDPSAGTAMGPMAHHMAHVMAATPYAPFSPGVTMSPGAFWGRPGSGANPLINTAVGAPVRGGYYGFPMQTPPMPQPQTAQDDGTARPDGYFPPVSQSPAPGEPAGYFPWVPPAQHQQQQQAQTGYERSSGLAHEILRDHNHDHHDHERGAGSGDGEARGSPGESDGTTARTSTGGPATGSSRGTSWHSHSDAEEAREKAQVRALARAGVAVSEHAIAGDGECVQGGEGEVNGGGSGSGNGHGKPRAYSAESAGWSAKGTLARADSDPIKRVLRGGA